MLHISVQLMFKSSNRLPVFIDVGLGRQEAREGGSREFYIKYRQKRT